LLVETQTPIGQIGELCGFGDEAHLKRLFRRRFGCTMRDWRRSPPQR
ncbi:MAG: AraC family transcriptional regulator, partial [Kiritimatiellae bacterium]|nr:AraC family transcriptional regulator [Kiritimatiellia bacterium]